VSLLTSSLNSTSSLFSCVFDLCKKKWKVIWSSLSESSFISNLFACRDSFCLNWSTFLIYLPFTTCWTCITWDFCNLDISNSSQALKQIRKKRISIFEYVVVFWSLNSNCIFIFFFIRVIGILFSFFNVLLKFSFPLFSLFFGNEGSNTWPLFILNFFYKNDYFNKSIKFHKSQQWKHKIRNNISETCWYFLWWIHFL
jgi:hypothetical protein